VCKSEQKGLCFVATICEVTVGVLAMTEPTKNWVGEYLQAALEVRAAKVPAQIDAARNAIAERLKELEGDSNHHAERRQMASALVSLATLEEEIKRWND
jgi:hypothetical protein